LDRGAIADAVDLEHLREALTDARDQALREAAIGAPHHPRPLGIRTGLDPELILVEPRLDFVDQFQAELAQLAFSDDRIAVNLDGRSRRNRDRIFAYARHGAPSS